jgi:hypothetical protein
MDCQEFRGTFSDFLDGAPGAADEIRFRRHLAACAPCRRFEAAYRTGVATLRDLDPPCPARAFSVRVLHRVRREPSLAILAGGYGLAGALLMVTLVGALVLDIRGREDTAAPSGLRLADTAPPPVASPDEGLDLITVRVRDAAAGLPLGDPWAAVPAAGSDPTYRLRFEVPAVWSGR